MSKEPTTIAKAFLRGENAGTRANHFNLMSVFGSNSARGQKCIKIRGASYATARRLKWTTRNIGFALIGRDADEHSFWRSYVGPDWIATVYVTESYSGRHVTRLRIRGNKRAAEETLMQAYLKHL